MLLRTQKMKWIIQILKMLIEVFLGKTKEETETYNDIGAEDEPKVKPRNPFSDTDFH